MRKLYLIIILAGCILCAGCTGSAADNTPIDKEPPQTEPLTNNSDLSNQNEPSFFLKNMPGTKKVVPKTSDDGLSLEYITYPKLSDQSSNYITKEWLDLLKIFEYDLFVPICFLDNENILISGRKRGEADEIIFRYNLNTKELVKVFKDPRYAGEPDLFINDHTHFVLSYDQALFFIDNDEVSKEIFIEDFQKKFKKYEIPQMAVHPETGKVLLLDYSNNSCLLTNLQASEFEELPFSRVYTAGWIDKENIFLFTFDSIDRPGKYFTGSALVIYNVENKTSAKTYLGEKEVFGLSYLSGAGYRGFNFLIDYAGPPYGTIGVLDYQEKRILFLELENAATSLYLRNNWIVVAVADKPIDWKVWGRTPEDKVLLCVYDVATGSYTIRAKGLSNPGKYNMVTDNAIISPDGKTIIYLTEGKPYINQAK